MTYSIVYSSTTGNTEQLAQAMKAALPEQDCLYYGPPDRKAQDAELIFVGFWTDKGGCDESVEAFLNSLEHKQVALFGTAGMGGSPDYFDDIAKRVGAHLPSHCRLLGHYLCQGKMPIGVRRRYESILAGKPEDEKLQAMLENFDRALQHPDAQDLAACQAFACKMME